MDKADQRREIAALCMAQLVGRQNTPAAAKKAVDAADALLAELAKPPTAKRAWEK